MLIKTNNNNLPDYVVDALFYEHYTGSTNEDAISVTTLIDSPYRRNLIKKYGKEIKEPTELDLLHVVTEDAADRMWSMLGSIGHSICERVSSERYTKEERLEHEIEYINYKGKASKAVISGQYDIFDTETNILYDNKYVTQWVLVYNPKGKKEWIEQMNVYAWLFHKVKGIEVKELKIVAWVRDSMQYDKAKHGRPDQDIMIIPLEVWSLEETEEFIRKRLAYHSSAEELSECTEEERWSKREQFAVMGKGAKAIKLYNDLSSAMDHVNKAAADLRVEHRPGEDTRCEKYCIYNTVCSYYQHKTKIGRI